MTACAGGTRIWMPGSGRISIYRSGGDYHSDFTGGLHLHIKVLVPPNDTLLDHISL